MLCFNNFCEKNEVKTLHKRITIFQFSPTRGECVCVFFTGLILIFLNDLFQAIEILCDDFPRSYWENK